ncbi:MAG: 50S ribosomal protein L24 [Thiotrichaceae bacterium]|jgi:large subunit ribosomal protein L24|uniref:Large ribosomal subunit protein uL24 n=1 Tax=Candidatus Thiocaldithrix dubininis TaxID=3080823 RepID=A0AA95H7T8_9GAMM|nr:MAG: 50S ribosomal protein L24 [Candidatus Thiocaldithrix dubininis]
MRKIRSNDEVVVITGKDKGRRGKVMQVLANGKVLVQGINRVKKHVKPNPNAGVQGGIVEKEMPMDSSNVMLVNPATGKGDRVGFKLLEDGKKVRVFKSNGERVDA